jgi:UDP-N-acetylmuramate: L-alanyl-gamma-D-glutamyl-meso-diaminopimelate ligase
MAPLACLLQAQGHTVRGSDNPLYPPMSTLLQGVGIVPLVGFDPVHLEPRPELVIVGNAVPRSNAEALAVEGLGIERISMPEALWRFFLAPRRRVVAAGSHGKTTTTALASWVWTVAGRDPSFLIGGLPKNLPGSFHLGNGETFLIEGDEYNAAYFDRGPKFWHYRPDVLILTSAELDHVDLYPTHESLLAAFAQLIEVMPATGLLVACADAPEVMELARRAPCPVISYGLDPATAAVAPRGGAVSLNADGSHFQIDDPESGPIAVHLAVPGRHNAQNALGVWAAARAEGIAPEAIVEAFATFGGVARRLEELGSAGGVTVIDDFAHHPSAVGESLAALAKRYPDRRIVAVYEPRSLTAGRSFLHDGYREALARAGRVFLGKLFYAERLAPDERLDVLRLARELSEGGVPTEACGSTDEVLARVLAVAEPGDVVVTMSSGSFDGLPRRILAGLGEKRT